jgi:hypothetical protein
MESTDMRSHHVTTEAEKSIPAATRSKDKARNPLWRLQREHGSVHSLLLLFWCPELLDSGFLLFSDTWFMALCYGHPVSMGRETLFAGLSSTRECGVSQPVKTRSFFHQQFVVFCIDILCMFC